MKTLAVFLVLPALIFAKINVDIIASDDKNQRQVHISGRNEDLISEQERLTFGLTDDRLKDAVNSFFGARPDDAFLRSPTPWGDLYITNNWMQVLRILKPLRARILSVSYQPVIVVRNPFYNNSTKPATFKTKIMQNVENTVSSTWERSSDLSTNQEIQYGFDIKAMAVSGKATFSYSSKWGENVEKSQTVTVGSETGLEITLQPHQSVTADLYATRGSMKIEVDYEATLSGSVAVNYANLYKNHHFWSLDINRIIEAGGMLRSVKSSEVIDLGFYSDSKVEVRDSDSNDVLYSVPLTVF